MRPKRNLKVNVFEETEVLETQPKTATNLTPENVFKRKGKSTPKALIGISQIYQQKLIIPKKERVRSTIKSPDADKQIEVESHKPTNLYLKPSANQDALLQFLTPTNKQRMARRILKDASQQRDSQERKRSSQKPRIEVLRRPKPQLRKAQTFEIEEPEKVVAQNGEVPVPASAYYIEQLKKYLNGFSQDSPLAHLYVNHFVQQFHALQYCRQFVQPEVKDLMEKFIPKRLVSSKHIDQFIAAPAKTLVLDLDETLVHCVEQANQKVDFKIPVQLPNGVVFEAGINVRPYVQNFLQEASKHFEVIVFTASHKNYASKIIDRLDPSQRLIHQRLYRENCIQMQQGMHIKDLRILNRNLKDVILVDNAAYSYAFQLDNGVPIVPFTDNRADKELLGLWEYLRLLLDAEDIREVNRRTFNFRQLQGCDSIDIAIKALFC